MNFFSNGHPSSKSMCKFSYTKFKISIRMQNFVYDGWFRIRFYRFRIRNYFYFHVNGSIGIVQKIDFEIRPDLGCVQPPKRREKWFCTIRLCVCLSCRLSVLLSLFPRALTGVRFNRSSWNFGGMFGYMGHCAVPIFEAIREPVYKII